MFGGATLLPGNTEHDLKMANQLVEFGRFNEALQIYMFLHEFSPNNIKVLEERARLYAQLKKSGELKEDLKKILYLKNPTKYNDANEMKDYESRYRKARAALNSTDRNTWEESEKNLAEIVNECNFQLNECNPEKMFDENYRKRMSGYLYCLGRLALLLGKQKQAKGVFLGAIFFDNRCLYNPVDPKNDVDPEDRLFALKFLHRHDDNDEKEVKHLSTAIRSEKNLKNHRYYFIRAKHYRKLNKLEKAFPDLLMASWICENFDEKPISIEVFIAMTRDMLIEMGRLKDATLAHKEILRYEEWIKKEKKFEYKPVEICQHDFVEEIIKHVPSFIRQKKFKLATDFLQHAITLEPKNVQLYLKLGHVYFLNKQVEEANDAYKNGLQQIPLNPQLLKELEKLKPKKKNISDPLLAKSIPIAENKVPQIGPIPLKHKEKFKKSPEELAAARAVRVEIMAKAKLEDQFKGTGPLILKELAEQKAKQNDEKRRKDHASAAKRKRNKKLRLRQGGEAKESEVQQDEWQQDELQLALTEMAKAQQKQEDEKARREAAFEELTKESKRRQDFIKKQDERIKQAIADKEKIPFSDMDKYYLDEKRVEVKSSEQTLMETLEDIGSSVTSIVYGGTARSRIAKLKGSHLHDPEKDLDILTTATPDQIKQSLANYQIKETAKKGQFQIQMIDENKNKIDIQITSTSCQKFKEFTQGLDFTINAGAFDKYGRPYDATGHAIEDLMARKLRTIKPPAESFAEDPSRTLRGADFMRRFNLTADDELLTQMEHWATFIPTKTDPWRIHSWMMRAFSRRFVTADQAIENFKFLSEERITPQGKKWNFLSKLFSVEAAELIQRASPWIHAELRKGPVTQKEIYMIFYVSLAMQKTPYDPIHTKREIYRDCPLIKDKLEGASNFGYLFNKYTKRWEHAHTEPELGQHQPLNSSMFSMFGGPVQGGGRGGMAVARHDALFRFPGS